MSGSGIAPLSLSDWLAVNTLDVLKTELDANKRYTINTISHHVQQILNLKNEGEEVARFASLLKELKFFSWESIDWERDSACQILRIKTLFLAAFGENKHFTQTVKDLEMNQRNKIYGKMVEAALRDEGNLGETLYHFFSDICDAASYSHIEELLNSERLSNLLLELQDNYGNTPLLRLLSHLELGVKLSREKPLSDVENFENKTRIFNLTKAIYLLIDKGADLWKRNNGDQSVLEVAIEIGDMSLVKKIIENIPNSRKKEFLNQKNREGFPPILTACFCRQYEVAKYLMQFSPEVFYESILGITILDHLKKVPGELQKIIYRAFITQMGKSPSIPEHMDLGALISYLKKDKIKVTQEEWDGLSRHANGNHLMAGKLKEALNSLKVEPKKKKREEVPGIDPDAKKSKTVEK